MGGYGVVRHERLGADYLREALCRTVIQNKKISLTEKAGGLG